MSTDKEKLDRFGLFLIENLYDEALSFYDHLIHRHWKAPSLLEVQAKVAALDPEQQEMVRKCVALAIDGAMHHFLFKLHEVSDNSAIGSIEYTIRILVDEMDITTISDGLQGEAYGEEGWIAKYSRFSDASDF